MAKIYLIFNQENGKKYVGQTTKCISQRFCQHIDAAFRNSKKKHNDFYREISSSGENVFKIFKYSLLEECADSSKDERELFYIQKIKPEYNENFKEYYLLNIKDKIIKEYIDGATISEIRKKYKCRYPFISNLLKSNGIKIQRSRNRYYKPIYLFDSNGVPIKRWANSGECASELKVDRSNIRVCCIKNTKENMLYFTANGNHYKYTNNIPKDMFRITNIKSGEIISFKTKESLVEYFKNCFPNKNILYGQLVRTRKTVYGYKIEKLYNHRN